MMLLLLLATLQAASCHLLKSDWIYGRDLAASAPALSMLPSEQKMGLSPVPGVSRVFTIADLNRIALANHIDAKATEDVCFAWEVAIPDRGQMKSAMERSLGETPASVEIVESSLLPAPEGEMVFPLHNFAGGSDKPAVWRGYVLYGEKRQYPIWARVVVTVKEKHLVLNSDLHSGDTIHSSQLRTEAYDGPLLRSRAVVDVSKAEGMLVRRPIQAGSTLVEDMLEPPREVNRGDVVDAVVQTGAARLEVQAIAENDGRKGQIIAVRNPRSGRSFHARVEEKGIVTVVPGGQFGLVVETKKS